MSANQLSLGMMMVGAMVNTIISHADLYAGGYLKDDKLVFCVSNIVVRSK